MRIEDRPPPPVQSAQSSDNAGRYSAPELFRPDSVEDRVSLSRLSQALLMLSTPRSRLEELRKLIQAGAYEIAADELSRRLVEFYLEPPAEKPGQAE